MHERAPVVPDLRGTIDLHTLQRMDSGEASGTNWCCCFGLRRPRHNDHEQADKEEYHQIGGQLPRYSINV